MEDHRPDRNKLEKPIHVEPGQGHLGIKSGPTEASLNSHQDGGSHCPECDRSALDHHSDHDRRCRRKAHGHHKRGTDGGRGPEPGGPLDERPEQPSQENDLDPSILTDGVERPADGGDTPGMLQGLEKEEGSKNDEEQVEGQKKALDGSGPNPDPLHLPGAHRNGDGGYVNAGHGPLGGNPKAHEKDARHKDWKNGQEGLHAESHPGILLRSPPPGAHPTSGDRALPPPGSARCPKSQMGQRSW